MRSHVVRILIVAFALAAFCRPASAQTAPQPAAKQDGDDIKGNIAGTVGLGLLGAELGLLLPPAFKLQDRWWAWVLFPTVGAAGGAVAGALAFDEGSPPPAVTVSLLGAGMALAIPAIVGAVAWKNKRDNAPPSDIQGGAAIRLGKVDRHWGVPSVTSAPVYSAAEQLRWGVPQRTALNVSLLSGKF